MHPLGPLLPFAASLLPRRWRARWGLLEGNALGPATVVTGLLEMALGALVLFRGYAAALREDAARGGGDAMFGLIWIAFLLGSWPGRIGLAILVEGAVRVISAFARSPSPLLVLWLAERAASVVTGAQARRGLVPLVEDVARVHGNILTIHTCRERDWDGFTTLDFEGTLWRLTGRRDDGEAARPIVYAFTPVPDTWAIRGAVVRYATRDVLL